MKSIIFLIVFSAIVICPNFAFSQGYTNVNDKNTESVKGEIMSDNINDIVVKDMNGKDIPLSSYKGKVLLIVNVASECGFTPQYEGLEKIYKEYHDKGFEILGFPCNDFGGQEPGTNEEIKNFCSTKFNVTFKLFDKVKILGEDKAPLYARLTNNSVTEKSDIGWNFEKFIISKEGKILARFKSRVTPGSEELTSEIEKALKN